MLSGSFLLFRFIPIAFVIVAVLLGESICFLPCKEVYHYGVFFVFSACFSCFCFLFLFLLSPNFCSM